MIPKEGLLIQPPIQHVRASPNTNNKESKNSNQPHINKITAQDLAKEMQIPLNKQTKAEAETKVAN